jgi:hypothetical protein
VMRCTTQTDPRTRQVVTACLRSEWTDVQAAPR